MSVRLQVHSPNRAMSRAAPTPSVMLQLKCACGGSSGLTGSCTECEKKKLVGQPLQKKLRINEPSDEYEQEADRVAEQVMRMAEPAKQKGASITTRAPQVQRRVSAHGAGIGAAPPIVHDSLASPGQPLDAATRASSRRASVTTLAESACMMTGAPRTQPKLYMHWRIPWDQMFHLIRDNTESTRPKGGVYWRMN